MALISSSVLPTIFFFYQLFKFLYSNEADPSRKGYRQLLETELHIPEMIMSVFSSITIPLLTYLNSKCFLENFVSLHNFMGISPMTMISVLIGLFEDLCLDIGNS